MQHDRTPDFSHGNSRITVQHEQISSQALDALICQLWPILLPMAISGTDSLELPLSFFNGLFSRPKKIRESPHSKSLAKHSAKHLVRWTCQPIIFGSWRSWLFFYLSFFVPSGWRFCRRSDQIGYPEWYPKLASNVAGKSPFSMDMSFFLEKSPISMIHFPVRHVWWHQRVC